MSAKIVFNGQMYDSAEQMPAEARQAYEQALALLADNNHNGVPDVVEQALPGQVQVAATNLVVFNGKTYHSVAEMPADIRRDYEALTATFDADRSGIPDIVQGMLPSASQPSPASPARSNPMVPMAATTVASTTPPDPAAALRRTGVIIAAVFFALAALLVIAAGIATMISQ